MEDPQAEPNYAAHKDLAKAMTSQIPKKEKINPAKA